MKKLWKWHWWRLLGAAAVVLGVVGLMDAEQEAIIFTLGLVPLVALPSYVVFKWMDRREHGSVPGETRERASAE